MSMNKKIGVALMVLALVVAAGEASAKSSKSSSRQRNVNRGYQSMKHKPKIKRLKRKPTNQQKAEQKKAEPAKPDSQQAKPETAQQPQVINNYYGNSAPSTSSPGGLSSSIAPALMGAAAGYAVSELSHRGDDKTPEPEPPKQEAEKKQEQEVENKLPEQNPLAK